MSAPHYDSICIINVVYPIYVGENTDDKAPSDIQQYCDIVLDHYKYQPVVPEDWLSQVGQGFFGRLAMLEIQDGKQSYRNNGVS